MKHIFKALCAIIVFVLMAGNLHAQPGPRGPRNGGNFERIKAARQAFITERLELTEAEAKAFFPIFWEYEEQLHGLNKEAKPERRERRQRLYSEDAHTKLTEEEARRQIEAHLDRMDRMHELKTASTRAYLKILPAVKLIELESANRDFRRELLEKLRERRGRH